MPRRCTVLYCTSVSRTYLIHVCIATNPPDSFPDFFTGSKEEDYRTDSGINNFKQRTFNTTEVPLRNLKSLGINDQRQLYNDAKRNCTKIYRQTVPLRPTILLGGHRSGPASKEASR
jgi:hypothetical protein